MRVKRLEPSDNLLFEQGSPKKLVVAPDVLEPSNAPTVAPTTPEPSAVPLVTTAAPIASAPSLANVSISLPTLLFLLA